MYVDSRLEFVTTSGGLGLALGAAAAGSTTQFPNVIPLSVIRNIGVGEPVYVVVVSQTDLICATATATITFDLVSESNTLNGSFPFMPSPTIVASSPTFTLTTSIGTTGVKARTKLWQYALPHIPSPSTELFYGMQFRVATNALVTGGFVTAFITPYPTAWQAYADAVN